MTRAQLRAIVQINYGRSDSNAVSVINAGLDEGLREIAKVYPFDAMNLECDITFVAGQSDIQLPAGINNIIELRMVDPANPTLSYSMDYRRKRWFVSKFPNVPQLPITGRPLFCYKQGNKLFLDRVSNGTYKIRVTYNIIDRFENDLSEPRIQNVESALSCYATFYAYRSVQMYTDAKIWFGEFARNLKTALDNEQSDNTTLRAEPWVSKPEISTNVPWQDPFAGQGR